jgi:hypothetical protein
VQDIDAVPSGMRIRYHGLEFGIAGHVGLECRGCAAFCADQVDRLMRRLQIVIHAQHASAFAREGQRGGAAVADAFARALAGADDDGDAIFQTHVSSLPGTASVPVCSWFIGDLQGRERADHDAVVRIGMA